MKPYDVFVPVPGSAAERMIDPGSAIVSDGRKSGGLVVAWYEGNRYGAENLRSYHARLACAAGRMAADYPTMAMSAFPEAELLRVAGFCPDRQAVIDVADAEALSRWAGEPPEDITGVRLEQGMQSSLAGFPQDQMTCTGRAPGAVTFFRTRAGQVVKASPAGIEVLPDPTAHDAHEPLSP